MADLSITALYTSQTWAWGRLPCAELFATTDGKRVFDATNAALAIAGLLRPELAPLRYALIQRHAMIDHLVRAAGRREIVELAAGLSRRGAAWTRDPGVRYTELDLPAMVAHKRALLERTAAGRSVLARPGFRLRAGDALTTDLTAEVTAGPVTVVAEGLLMYLDADAQAQLFAQVRRLGDVQLVFDLTPGSEEPVPGAIGRALARAMKRFTGGRGFARDQRTRADVLAALRAAGFAEARAIAARDVAQAWALPHAARATPTVVFEARATPGVAPATRS